MKQFHENGERHACMAYTKIDDEKLAEVSGGHTRDANGREHIEREEYVDEYGCRRIEITCCPKG